MEPSVSEESHGSDSPEHLPRPDWQHQAACRDHPDPDAFYSTDDDQQAELIAGYCERCPVRTECLVDALDRGDTEGIWGGTTPDQRRDITRLAQEITRE